MTGRDQLTPRAQMPRPAMIRSSLQQPWLQVVDLLIDLAPWSPVFAGSRRKLPIWWGVGSISWLGDDLVASHPDKYDALIPNAETAIEGGRRGVRYYLDNLEFRRQGCGAVDVPPSW